MHATVTVQLLPTSTAAVLHEWVAVPSGMVMVRTLAHLHVGPLPTHEAETHVYVAGPEAVREALNKHDGETTASAPAAPPVQGPERHWYPERPRLIGREAMRFPHCAEATATSALRSLRRRRNKQRQPAAAWLPPSPVDTAGGGEKGGGDVEKGDLSVCV